MKIKYFCSVCGKLATENEVCKNCKYMEGLVKINSLTTKMKEETKENDNPTYYLIFEGQREEK